MVDIFKNVCYNTITIQFWRVIMKEIMVSLDEEMLKQATKVLDDIGIDMQGAIRMFVRRIVREQSIAFVLPTTSAVAVAVEEPKKKAVIKVDKGEMKPILAKKIFRERGHNFLEATFASKNTTTYRYWANPQVSVLKEDWTLILNDWANRKLYLLKIPKNTIGEGILGIRVLNGKELLNIQIVDDEELTDKVSSYKFRPFVKDQVDY